VNGEEVGSDEVARLQNLADNGFSLIEGAEVKLDLGTFTLILMPRGSSKTTIAGLAVPLYKLLYKMEKFTLFVSKADRHAQGQLESVRKELVQNEVIREIFGDLKPKRSEEEAWSKEKFETISGIAIQARGKGSAIRGVNHNNYRPSCIIVDDPQSKSDCKSDIVRVDDKKWAFAELTPARARVVGTRGTITVLATWLHKDCLAAVWSRDPRWTCVKLGIKDLDGAYIWPDYMDAKEETAEKESFRLAGLLGDFYREYYNKEVILSEVPFLSEFVIYDPEPPLGDMVCATFADLATGEKRVDDFSAIVTIGLSPKGVVWLLDAWVERVGIEEELKVEEYFRQSQKWKSQLHGFESNAYQAVFGTLLHAEMHRRGHYFEVLPVRHKTRKVDRIRGALRPRYASGHFRHRTSFSEYENQLFDFRYDMSHDHDDGPDAAAAALVLLDPACAFFAEADPAIDSMEPLEMVEGEDFEVIRDYETAVADGKLLEENWAS
jgi:predicted phage terminase large subunit-like protein